VELRGIAEIAGIAATTGRGTDARGRLVTRAGTIRRASIERFWALEAELR
jgi:hypothetical protein